jgi:hypothetical protein
MIAIYKQNGSGFRTVTPTNYNPFYSQHSTVYTNQYVGTPLYRQSDIELRAMVARVKNGIRRPFITSDVEIGGILQNLGNNFSVAYQAFSLPVSMEGMLGVQLFNILVYDNVRWWYTVPKPILNGHLLSHSHYCIPQTHKRYAFL